MRFSIINFSVFIFIWFSFSNVFAERTMTLEELFFDNSKPFHLKILEAIPEKGIVQIGPADAENTIIEFEKERNAQPNLESIVELIDNYFSTLQEKYSWGTNFYYYLSAKNDIPTNSSLQRMPKIRG